VLFNNSIPILLYSSKVFKIVWWIHITVILSQQVQGKKTRPLKIGNFEDSTEQSEFIYSTYSRTNICPCISRQIANIKKLFLPRTTHLSTPKIHDYLGIYPRTIQLRKCTIKWITHDSIAQKTIVPSNTNGHLLFSPCKINIEFQKRRNYSPVIIS